MLGMTISSEAEKFIREHGRSAYDKVREAINGARRSRNARLERFLVRVARQIELRSEKAIEARPRARAARFTIINRVPRSAPGELRARSNWHANRAIPAPLVGHYV